MKDRTTQALIDTVTLWTETNQRVLRELVELGSGTAREGMQLYTELQRSALDAFRESQAAALRWQGSWTAMVSDPSALYRQAVAEGVTGAQQGFRLAEEGTQALTRMAGRVQAATEAASKGIQETCAGAATRLQAIYTA
jgi:hypothetical protein